VHPAYLSREFSKYFDDLSFGDYIRKLRIEKATQLLEQSTLYPLVTGRDAEAVIPGGTRAVVMADPGSYQVYWEQGGAVVHLTVPLSEDLDTILAAVVVKS